MSGYTKDTVDIKCEVCGKEETCHWTRNKTPGMNLGRPMIELPDDWKVIMDFVKGEQKPLCPNCHPEELTPTPNKPILFNPKVRGNG